MIGELDDEEISFLIDKYEKRIVDQYGETIPIEL